MVIRMRYLIALTCLLPALGWAQTDNEYLDSLESQTRNVIGFVPSKANVINGWAIGYGFTLSSPHSSTRTIKGVYTNVQPLNALLLGFASPYLIANPILQLTNSRGVSDTTKALKKWIPDYDFNDTLNGVALHLFGIGFSDDYVINGVEICPGIINGGQLKGFSLSLGAEHNEMVGCIISGFYNFLEKGRGVQMALVNDASEFRGVQIGLLNRIGNRVFPFVNFNFKRPQKAQEGLNH